VRCPGFCGLAAFVEVLCCGGNVLCGESVFHHFGACEDACLTVRAYWKAKSQGRGYAKLCVWETRLKPAG
jgi:hypothetical protein